MLRLRKYEAPGPKILLEVSSLKYQALSQKIRALNGHCIKSQCFEKNATHLITDFIRYSEKFLGACVRGLWVLSPKYIEDSYKAGTWMKEGDYERDLQQTNSAFELIAVAKRWRWKISNFDEQPFTGMHVALLGTIAASYERLLVFGGAQVLKLSIPLREDINLSHISYVFTDPSYSEHVQVLQEFGLICLHYKFIEDSIIREENLDILEYMVKEDIDANYLIYRSLSHFKGQKKVYMLDVGLIESETIQTIHIADGISSFVDFTEDEKSISLNALATKNPLSKTQKESFQITSLTPSSSTWHSVCTDRPSYVTAKNGFSRWDRNDDVHLKNVTNLCPKNKPTVEVKDAVSSEPPKITIRINRDVWNECAREKTLKGFQGHIRMQEYNEKPNMGGKLSSSVVGETTEKSLDKQRIMKTADERSLTQNSEYKYESFDTVCQYPNDILLATVESKPHETAKPQTAHLQVISNLQETARHCETVKPCETVKTHEITKPYETAKVQIAKPHETVKPPETAEVQIVQLLETSKQCETTKPLETAKVNETGEILCKLGSFKNLVNVNFPSAGQNGIKITYSSESGKCQINACSNQTKQDSGKKHNTEKRNNNLVISLQLIPSEQSDQQSSVPQMTSVQQLSQINQHTSQVSQQISTGDQQNSPVGQQESPGGWQESPGAEQVPQPVQQMSLHGQQVPGVQMHSVIDDNLSQTSHSVFHMPKHENSHASINSCVIHTGTDFSEDDDDVVILKIIKGSPEATTSTAGRQNSREKHRSLWRDICIDDEPLEMKTQESSSSNPSRSLFVTQNSDFNKLHLPTSPLEASSIGSRSPLELQSPCLKKQTPPQFDKLSSASLQKMSKNFQTQLHRFGFSSVSRKDAGAKEGLPLNIKTSPPSNSHAGFRAQNEPATAVKETLLAHTKPRPRKQRLLDSTSSEVHVIGGSSHIRGEEPFTAVASAQSHRDINTSGTVHGYAELNNPPSQSQSYDADLPQKGTHIQQDLVKQRLINAALSHGEHTVIDCSEVSSASKDSEISMAVESVKYNSSSSSTASADITDIKSILSQSSGTNKLQQKVAHTQRGLCKRRVTNDTCLYSDSKISKKSAQSASVIFDATSTDSQADWTSGSNPTHNSNSNNNYIPDNNVQSDSQPCGCNLSNSSSCVLKLSHSPPLCHSSCSSNLSSCGPVLPHSPPCGSKLPHSPPCGSKLPHSPPCGSKLPHSPPCGSKLPHSPPCGSKLSDSSLGSFSLSHFSLCVSKQSKQAICTRRGLAKRKLFPTAVSLTDDHNDFDSKAASDEYHGYNICATAESDRPNAVTHDESNDGNYYNVSHGERTVVECSEVSSANKDSEISMAAESVKHNFSFSSTASADITDIKSILSQSSGTNKLQQKVAHTQRGLCKRRVTNDTCLYSDSKISRKSAQSASVIFNETSTDNEVDWKSGSNPIRNSSSYNSYIPDNNVQFDSQPCGSNLSNSSSCVLKLSHSPPLCHSSCSSNLSLCGPELPHSPPCGSKLPHSPPCGSKLPHSPPCGSKLPHSSPCGSKLPHSSPCGSKLPQSSPCGSKLSHSPPCGSKLPHSPPCGSKFPHSPPCGSKLPLSPPCGSKLPHSPPCGSKLSDSSLDSFSLSHSSLCGSKQSKQAIRTQRGLARRKFFPTAVSLTDDHNDFDLKAASATAEGDQSTAVTHDESNDGDYHNIITSHLHPKINLQPSHCPSHCKQMTKGSTTEVTIQSDMGSVDSTSGSSQLKAEQTDSLCSRINMTVVTSSLNDVMCENKSVQKFTSDNVQSLSLENCTSDRSLFESFSTYCREMKSETHQKLSSKATILGFVESKPSSNFELSVSAVKHTISSNSRCLNVTEMSILREENLLVDMKEPEDCLDGLTRQENVSDEPVDGLPSVTIGLLASPSLVCHNLDEKAGGEATNGVSITNELISHEPCLTSSSSIETSSLNFEKHAEIQVEAYENTHVEPCTEIQVNKLEIEPTTSTLTMESNPLWPLTYLSPLRTFTSETTSYLPVIYGQWMESSREMGFYVQAIIHGKPSISSLPTRLLLSELVLLARCPEDDVCSQAVCYLTTWLELHPPVTPEVIKLYTDAFKLCSESSPVFDVIRDVADESKQSTAVTLLEYFVSLFEINFDYSLRSGEKAVLQKSLIVKWLWPGSLTFARSMTTNCLLKLFHKLLEAPVCNWRACAAICALLNLACECLRLVNIQWNPSNPRFAIDSLITMSHEIANRIVSSLKSDNKARILVVDMLRPAWVRILVVAKLLSDYNNYLLTEPVNVKNISMKSIVSQFFFLVPLESGSGLHSCKEHYHPLEETSKLTEIEHDTKKSKGQKGILTADKVNKRNGKGESAIHIACMKNKVADLERLLAVPGADINLRDNNGWTPLHEACHHGNTACVELLLKYVPNTTAGASSNPETKSCKVEIDAAGPEGLTPLHDAVCSNRINVCQLMLRYGGRKLLQSRTHANQTAADLAQSDEMRAVLNSFSEASSHLDVSVSQDVDDPDMDAVLDVAPLTQRYKELTGAECSHLSSRSSCEEFITLLAVLVSSYYSILGSLEEWGHIGPKEKEVLGNMNLHLMLFRRHIRKLTTPEDFDNLQVRLKCFQALCIYDPERIYL